MKVSNLKSEYSQMYLVPQSIYHKIIDSVPDKSEKDEIEQWNQNDTEKFTI